MTSWIVPPIYAAFIWWFSTGAVLLLVGRRGRSDGLRAVSAAGLLAGSLAGLALSSNDPSPGGAYAAFTCTILLWGAQEIAFLAGWVTGPRPRFCPAGVRGWTRLSLALQAILYHELTLLACGGAVVALTWNGSNQIGLWTFAALWVLRQSAKINLFLGVPVTNDELMPEAVQFLKTFFARKPVGAFFPISVTLATAVLVIMIQRIVEVAATPFDVVGLTLVSTLFALGVVEHWFMLLPLPAITLWGWGMRSPFPPEDNIMENGPDAKPASVPPNLVVLSSVRPEAAPAKTQSHCARQRLEDQFRQRFLEQNARSDLPAALGIGAEPAATVNGRTS
ncbi:putative photosynthetic complex assembly protein PuhE [uncultured Bradyrhizobium sp.]|uniref:putative photosynthetic complex assembly protein PuhE n=1 Tax=uncultured Bradyrhizobium sp. TaxID=199684 RepID=UPI0035CAD5C2